MKLFPRYARLPISTPVATLALFILMMVLWLQGGLSSIYKHLYLLIGSYLSWGLLLPFLQGLVEEVSHQNKRSWFWGILMAVELIIIHFLLSNVVYYSLQMVFIEGTQLPSLGEIKSFIIPSLLGRMVDFVMFFGLLSWVNQTKSFSENRVQLAQAEAQLQKSRLDTLKSQLNPHFLFNTLHAISSLIGYDDDKARKITIKISSLLRKTLKANEKVSHSLKEEMDLIEEYLDIEAERFSDRLQVIKEIDPACLELNLPTLILQPLIENAFKHGVAQVEGKTSLFISIQAEKQNIKILIKNDLNKHASLRVPSTKIGLKNLQERLKLHYQHQYSLEYGAKGTQFMSALTLPLP